MFSQLCDIGSIKALEEIWSIIHEVIQINGKGPDVTNLYIKFLNCTPRTNSVAFENKIIKPSLTPSKHAFIILSELRDRGSCFKKMDVAFNLF